MSRSCAVALVMAGSLVVAAPAGAADGGAFDPAPVWPLCGRITEDPPPGWDERDGCPAGRSGSPDHTDAPVSSTYGPRLLCSEGLRYDFHRGIDIGTPTGTPVFAFADGVVRKAGPDPAYSDPLVQLRHYRPGHGGSCAGGGGCYHTNYLHMSGWTVAVDDVVAKGDLIGYSGASASGFQHVHFEIRDAPPQDPFSNWQRDTIHPLSVLAYPDTGAANLELTLDAVDASNPLQPRVSATVRIPMSVELDLETVAAEVLERAPDGTLTHVPQTGEIPVGITPEGVGYWVEPPWFSMEVWNRQYTYKNSSSFPWSSFTQGGMWESPYWPVMPPSYDPHVHLDAQHPDDFQVGLFNGIAIAPNHTNASSTEYVVSFDFLALDGVADAASLCIRVRALDVGGSATPWRHRGCLPPAPFLTLDTAQLSWDAIVPAQGYDVVRGELGALAASGGDYALATETCVADDVVVTAVAHGGSPPRGQAYWYLARAVPAWPVGSYDSGGAGQAGPRDTGIETSGHGCP